MEKYKILKYQELEDLLVIEFGKEYFHFYRDQLPTNYGFIYELKNKRIFLPSSNGYDGVLFDSEVDLQKMIDKDEFPIENPEKTTFEYDSKRILEFHKYER